MGSYPAGTLQVKLAPCSVLSDQSGSLLSPVRRYKGDLQSTGRWAAHSRSSPRTADSSAGPALPHPAPASS